MSDFFISPAAGATVARRHAGAAQARRFFARALGVLGALGVLIFVGLPGLARADSVDTLRSFARDVKTGQAEFTQTVVSPDGLRKKESTGHFAFSRPNRFRFSYAKPFEQLIVSDGQQVWLYDIDLNQINVRPLDKSLGGTPAALLAGGDLERDFTLQAQPSSEGIDWVLATPRQADSTVRALRVGFKGQTLSVLALTDAFGQQSTLRFSKVEQGAALPAETFQFTPPKGVDVIRQ